LTFHSYDEWGNLRSVSKDGAGQISYLYGHGFELPVAQANNASNGQIFYESFEEVDGNSGEYDSKTGRRSRIGGYTKVLSGVANGSYTLTYYQKTAGIWTPVSVNNIVVSAGT
jgi:hypothetical protein